MPDNNAESWGAFLLKLADEAEHDAGEHDTALSLHVTLKDLANVARAYVDRLGVERTGKVTAPPATVGFTDLLMGAEIPVSPAVPFELPDWLLDAINLMRKKIEDLEVRVTDLENNQQKQTVDVSSLRLDPAAAAIDDDRTAWDSIDRARAALRGMVIRKHRDMTRIRQRVLDRVTALAKQVVRTSDENAELNQHEARSHELAEIDAIAGVKLDEIAALDDLELARLFDVEKGWPS
jgi:hypothetical protein